MASFRVRHSGGWKSCTFSFVSDFVTKTQNLLVHDPRFEEFTIPSLDGFVGGDRDELELCPIGALRKYLFWTEQYCLVISNLFASMTVRKKQMS